MREIAADDGEVPRRETLDVVADQGHAFALAHEVDFVLGMHVPNVALPGIIVQAPQKGLACISYNVLDDRGDRNSVDFLSAAQVTFPGWVETFEGPDILSALIAVVRHAGKSVVQIVFSRPPRRQLSTH